ncbi:MAG: L,D-transpeptidase [bacterium]|nr:L,D-transpeptidase [bacterium]
MKKKKKYKNNYKKLIIVGFVSSVVFFLVLGVLVFLRSQNTACANSVSCIKDLSGRYDSGKKEAVYLGKTIAIPKEEKRDETKTAVLGEKTSSDKHIYVDLAAQKLYAYQDGKEIMNFLISSGKWGKTPTGDFTIWVKLRYTTMSGGSSAIGTYYNLPNVPYVMFFYNDEVSKDRGFSLHATYWHNNFGHPMSHGCVNLRVEDAEKLYYWTNPSVKGNTTYADNNNSGTQITIYGIPPLE